MRIVKLEYYNIMRRYNTVVKTSWTKGCPRECVLSTICQSAQQSRLYSYL